MIRTTTFQILQNLMKPHDNSGHGYTHVQTVYKHARKALEYEPTLTDQQKLQVQLAALLHDADDEKIFPDSKNYSNARDILNTSYPDQPELHEQIIDLIKLVSTRQNGDSDVEQSWMAIPRDCDRLEALGQIGLDRTLAYAQHKGNPMHLDTTPRCFTKEELYKIATPERFAAYSSGKISSDSVIDHCYDKLLHIGSPSSLKSNNPYILQVAAERNGIIEDFVLNYWRQPNNIVSTFAKI